jgi:hypothetical protein
MSERDGGFGPMADIPAPDPVLSPRITVAERAIEVVVTDRDDRRITMRFQPYQAMRMTTGDCYRPTDGRPGHPERIEWARSSALLDELTAALAEVDSRATFMEDAVHVIIPAGDDVLEVVATRIEITPDGAETIVLPEGAPRHFWERAADV